MSDERAELAGAVDRLEQITERLSDTTLPADELKALAEEAMETSAKVSELLPQIIRAIERASEGTSSAEETR